MGIEVELLNRKYEKQLETVKQILEERKTILKEQAAGWQEALARNLIAFDREQGRALVYAQEAYYSAGPVIHVVKGMQSGGRVDLTPNQKLQSILMNIGYKLQHYEHIRQEKGETYFAFGRDLRAVVSAHPAGRARMLVHPEEIIVSLSPFDSSARNSFPGRVTRIEERGEKVAVEADIGVSLVAVITPASYKRFGLKLGSPVYLTFKASAVSVF